MMRFSVSAFDGTYSMPHAKWGKVARGAISVVALTQRSTGLWTLPTSKRELSLTWAPEGSLEHGLRSAEAFGSETISVTWNAMHALKSVLGTVPPAITAPAFARLGNCYSDGAYGTHVPGIQGGLRINSSARHSAMALLVHLDFSEEISPQARLRILEPTVKWIVAHRSEGGGWPFEEARPESDQPFTTTVCVSALACFLADIERRRIAVEPTLVESVTNAVQSGFEKLLKMRSSSLWEGIYKDSEVADSAFMLDLLWMAFQRGGLQTAVPGARSALLFLRDQLLATWEGGGWPETYGGKEPTLAATTAALLALANVPDARSESNRKVAEADRFVLDRLFRRDGPETLKAWDWPILASLAAIRGKQLSEANVHQLLRVCSEVKQAADHEQLTALRAWRLSKIARGAVWFALTRGQSYPGFSIRKLIKWALAFVACSVAGVFHEKIGHFIEHVFSNLLGLLDSH